jgi:hypothetical protein
MEVETGFAEGSVIIIGNKVVPVRIISGTGESLRILAHADIDYVSAQEVVLRMPEPKRPSELSVSPDQRTLGLAIPVTPAAYA